MLKYEDEDGDMITLSSSNDFRDLMASTNETANVYVSIAATLLPSVSNHAQRFSAHTRQSAIPSTPIGNSPVSQGNWNLRSASNTPRSISFFLPPFLNSLLLKH